MVSIKNLKQLATLACTLLLHPIYSAVADDKVTVQLRDLSGKILIKELEIEKNMSYNQLINSITQKHKVTPADGKFIRLYRGDNSNQLSSSSFSNVRKKIRNGDTLHLVWGMIKGTQDIEKKDDREPSLKDNRITIFVDGKEKGATFMRRLEIHQNIEYDELLNRAKKDMPGFSADNKLNYLIYKGKKLESQKAFAKYMQKAQSGDTLQLRTKNQNNHGSVDKNKTKDKSQNKNDKVMIVVFRPPNDKIKIEVNRSIEYHEILDMIKKKKGIASNKAIKILAPSDEISWGYLDKTSFSRYINKAKNGDSLTFEVVNQDNVSENSVSFNTPNKINFQSTSNESDNNDTWDWSPSDYGPDGNPLNRNNQNRVNFQITSNENDVNVDELNNKMNDDVQNQSGNISLVVNLLGTANRWQGLANQVLSIKNFSKKDISLAKIKSKIADNTSMMRDQIKSDYKENVAKRKFKLIYKNESVLLSEDDITDEFLLKEIDEKGKDTLEFCIETVSDSSNDENEVIDTNDNKTSEPPKYDINQEKNVNTEPLSDDGTNVKKLKKTNNNLANQNQGDHTPPFLTGKQIGIIVVIAFAVLGVIGFIYYKINQKEAKKNRRLI